MVAFDFTSSWISQHRQRRVQSSLQKSLLCTANSSAIQHSATSTGIIPEKPSRLDIALLLTLSHFDVLNWYFNKICLVIRRFRVKLGDGNHTLTCPGPPKGRSPPRSRNAASQSLEVSSVGIYMNEAVRIRTNTKPGSSVRFGQEFLKRTFPCLLLTQSRSTESRSCTLPYTGRHTRDENRW